jgi:anti-sigma B factor antagonist
MDLDVTTSVLGDDAVLSVDGEIDLTSCGQLRDEIEAIDLERAPNVVIDLTHVGFIDSTGLSVLVGAARRARQDGRRFGVVAEGHLHELLHLTGLDTVMTVHRKLDEATDQDLGSS